MQSIEVMCRPDLSWQDKISYLAWKIRERGGAKPEDIPLRHIFEAGRYIREMTLPGGFLFIGRPHLKGHIVLLVSGSATVFRPDLGPTRYVAPDAMLTRPGFQMVAHIHSPSVVRTIHDDWTGNENIEELEDEIFAPAEPVLLRGQAVQERLQKLLGDS
jgi:hypothetical protein